MADHHNKKRFLNMPKYPGGSEAFREFISANLQYPQAALEANVGGTVIVEYDIHDNGVVQNPRVLKGIGYGCNEEALRIVGLLRFEKVKNRGLRVKLTTKTNINFILPGIRLNYTFSGETDAKTQKDQPGQHDSTPAVYEYTVTF